MTTIHIDSSHNAELNFHVLKRIDKVIEEIIASANFCAVYEFNEETQTWAKKNIEGALFIVRRSSAPLYRVWVLNRIGKQNLVQDITNQLELNLKKGFYIIRDVQTIQTLGKPNLYAFWFPEEDKDAAQIVMKTLNKLIRESPPVTASIAIPSSTASSANHDNNAGQVLLSMLQKGVPQVTSTALPSSTSATFTTDSSSSSSSHSSSTASVASAVASTGMAPSVAAFFNAAKTTTNGQQPSLSKSSTNVASISSSSSNTVSPLTKTQLQNVLINLLHEDSFIDLLHSRYLKSIQKG